ncbi:hypothetical protein EDB19DRAFT_1719188 [Suillus lakei]|nr:hypothetical protein EDB19DRAFT_1719188 [Suillus lakei]
MLFTPLRLPSFLLYIIFKLMYLILDTLAPCGSHVFVHMYISHSRSCFTIDCAMLLEEMLKCRPKVCPNVAKVPICSAIRLL